MWFYLFVSHNLQEHNVSENNVCYHFNIMDSESDIWWFKVMTPTLSSGFQMTLELLL